jgi:multidrug efflux pump subunit AcrB
VKDKEKQFSDMNLKLNQLNLPNGAGPIQFNSNFGDTTALMLTVASPMDVANSATSAMSGVPVTSLQDGDKNIPVVARLKMDERARLSDMQNLYVYSQSADSKIPLVQISNIQNSMATTASFASITSAPCPSLLFPRRAILLRKSPTSRYRN